MEVNIKNELFIDSFPTFGLFCLLANVPLKRIPIPFRPYAFRFSSNFLGESGLIDISGSGICPTSVGTGSAR